MSSAPVRVGLALLSTAALLLTSAVSSAGAAPSGAQPGPRTPQANLDWRPCSDEDLPARARCTWVTVPRDWAEPSTSGTYRIRVARIAAVRDRIGVLTFNPGGPGGAGVGLLDLVYQWLPPEARDRFDVVAWDPRGVGRSEPQLRPCTWNQPTFPATGPIDVTALTQEWYDAVAQANEECASLNAEHVGNLGTWQVIRDLDAIRSALGERQITLWGMSYGTTVGRAYAQAFPSRLRALVLDGAIDPAPSMHSYMREHIWSDVTAVQRMLGAFGGRYTKTYNRAMRYLEENVLTSEGDTLTRWQFGFYMQALSTRQGSWPAAMKVLDQVERALADPRERTAERVKRLADLMDLSQLPDWSPDPLPTQAGKSNEFNSILGFVNCSDMHDRPSVEALARAGSEAIGVGGTSYLVPVLREGAQCAGLPPLGRSLPGLTTILRLSPRPVVINAVADNATPYLGARELANAFARAPMVVYDGTQHVAYGRTSACVDRPVTNYLVSLTLPPRSTVCPLAWRAPART